MAAAGAGADLVTYVAAGRAAGPPRDHAERVAAGVAAALDLPLVGLLAPAGGPDLGRARQRRRAAGAPAVRAVRPAPRARRRLAGGRVLVVDDLATTGATLAGAAAALRAAGARRVEVAVLGAASTALGPAPAGAVTPGLPRPPPSALRAPATRRLRRRARSAGTTAAASGPPTGPSRSILLVLPSAIMVLPGFLSTYRGRIVWL
jgi:hypothetical protein